MHPLAFLTVLPLALACLAMLARTSRQAGILVSAGLWLQAVVVAICTSAVLLGRVSFLRLADDFAIDRIGASFMLLTTVVVASATTHGNLFFTREQKATRQQTPVKLIYASTCLFLLAMTCVFACDNLGGLWIAIEATTLCSAPMVYFHRTKQALEATWKYLIICSVGIAFALLGTVLIFASSQHGTAGEATLRISELIASGPSLQYHLLRLGFIFAILGYGTKAGMFPIHSWLPDAHSEAPAPASAMLSGALLNCALFGIWRLSQIMLAAKQTTSIDLIVWVGTITVVAASFFLIRQRALKRLWAYSSIENVGIMLVAIGLGSGMLFFLQALNHSLAKVSLFLLSGNIVQATQAHKISDMRGVARYAPAWALLMTLGACAVTGVPPFGSFLSEWLILAESSNPHYWYVALALLSGISVAFVAVGVHMGRVMFGKPKSGVEQFRPIATSIIPALLLACSLALGFTTGKGWLVIQ